MKPKLCLMFCDYFQAEVEWLLKSEQYQDIRLFFYSADCDKTQQSPAILEMISAQAKTDSVIIFAGVCLTHRLKKFVNADFQVQPLDICFELLLPPDVLHQTLAQGAHLLTDGMLKRWAQVNQDWGFDDTARKAFFAEGTDKLVLITHPHLPADEITMAEIAAQLDLPWEKLEMPLDYLAMRVLMVINNWRARVLEFGTDASETVKVSPLNVLLF